ncbi:hypothetical protein Tco_1030137 [Tanacetum coccineum]|uniref:Transposase (Putative), gypsy type n=1 Tax=Tanacetum coccineum TaxID=301880 RepID=A0ABQ5G5N7_9ASTR
MGNIDSVRPVLTQSALDASCEKYHIPDNVHLELPAPNSRIRHGPVGKIGLYNSVHGFEQTIGNFRRFYVNSKNKGWMSFSKRPKNPRVCYTKPLDSLKNWNHRFFWVDSSIFPYAILWHTTQTVGKDPPSLPTKYDADVCDYLASNPAPFRKFLEHFLCFVGISRYYTLDEGCYPTYWDDEDREMDLFTFTHHENPTKLEKGNQEDVTHENVNIEGDADDAQDENVNVEGDADVVAPNQSEEGHVVQFGGIEIVADDERLRGDHNVSGSGGASTGGKSLAAIQKLLEQSTLNVEVGATAATTVPFFTSFVTPTPEHKGGDYTDSVTGPNLRMQKPAKRFVVSSDSIPASNNSVVDEEVTSVVRSVAPVSAVLTTAATAFANSASPSAARADIAGPSQTVHSEYSSGSFFVSQDMEPRTLEQIYIPKWDVVNDSGLEDPDVCRSFVDHLAHLGFLSQLRAIDYERLLAEFNVRAARQSSFNAEIRMRLEHELRGRHRLEERCTLQVDRLKEKDLEIANLKAQLALKEAKAAEAIPLEGQVAALESASNSQVTELSHNVLNLQVSYDELDLRASSLALEKDKLADQVFALESTCTSLRVEVSGYKLFKEQIEAMQDEQIKVLSKRIAAALRATIRRAIDKGMHDGLRAGVDHRKAGRGLDVIAAYDPSAQTNFVSAVNALRAGPVVELPGSSQLQPSFEQLIIPIRRLMDQVVVREVPLSSALDVAHSHVQKLKLDAKACCLSLMDGIVPLVEPLSAKSLAGEASSSMVPPVTATTTLATTFASVLATKVPPSSIVFEEEELDTTPEHALAS